MPNLIEQLRKLFRLKLFFLESIIRSFFGDKFSQKVLTELYMKSKLSPLLWADTKISRSRLSDIFPGIDSIAVEVYLQRASIASGVYDPSTEYLVSPLELSTLSSIAKFLAPSSYFEFGTYKGWTLANVVLNLPATSKIYSIDQIPNASSDPRVHSILNASNIVRLTGNTYDYDFNAFEGKMDLVFIDGGHDYETVKNDTRIAMRLLAPKGVLLWHDYNREHPGVYDFLNELSRELPLVLIETTSLVVFLKR